MKVLNIFILDDHEFYCLDIIEYLREMKHNVVYIKSFKDAIAYFQEHPQQMFDFSLIDIILSNGKTGVHFVSQYEQRLGKILFITGCVDENTLQTIQKWDFVNKQDNVLEKIDMYINTLIK